MTSEEIKKALFDSIKLGTGKAYLLLKKHPNLDFSKEIVRGAIRNLSQDPQCESSRADYLYRLINHSKQKDRIIRLVLARLRFQKGNRYDLDQLCDLAVKFHKAGYTEARVALNQRVLKNSLEDYTFCGLDQLIEIDGVAGLIQVAKIVGEILYHDPSDSDDSYRVDEFQMKNPEVDIYAELQKASKGDKFIQAYYQTILANKWQEPGSRGSNKRIERFSYELIKEKLESKFPTFLHSKRTSELTEAETEKLAVEFLNETDVRRKERYLRFFGSRKFPFDYQPIFEIAKGPNPPESWFVHFAIEALKHFRADELRTFAIENLMSDPNPGDYIKLLTNNYESGDHVLLAEIARNAKGDEEVHTIGTEIIDLYTAVSTEECREPLEVIYDRMNCGIHRSALVAVLTKNNVLSERILLEMEFDSDEKVRELFRKLKTERA